MSPSANRRFFPRRYEVLLIVLVQHLFVGIVLRDMDLYTRFVWPVNMVFVGMAGVMVFQGRHKGNRIMRNILAVSVILLPVSYSIMGQWPYFMPVVSAVYVLFFGVMLYDVMRYLSGPGQIDIHAISAAACGFLLLLELFVFGLLLLLSFDPDMLAPIDTQSPATTFIDLVYFSTIVLTSIGFGDITPKAHYVKLLVSFMGILGHFYSVVLVGILVGRYAGSRPGN